MENKFSDEVYMRENGWKVWGVYGEYREYTKKYFMEK